MTTSLLSIASLDQQSALHTCLRCQGRARQPSDLTLTGTGDANGISCDTSPRPGASLTFTKEEGPALL
jgi:hypothetical protein